MERVGLSEVGGDYLRGFSLGMRQRLAIAGTLLAPRELLVLDEPTNGLDPQGTREVRHLIGSLADDGATVLVSSHLLSEVEQVCTHIGVMHVGRLLTQGPIAEVRAVSEPRARVQTDQPAEAARVLRALGLTNIAIESGVVVGTLGALVPDRVVAALVHEGVPVTGFAVAQPSLEDLFVSLTGEGFNVSG